MKNTELRKKTLKTNAFKLTTLVDRRRIFWRTCLSCYYVTCFVSLMYLECLTHRKTKIRTWWNWFVIIVWERLQIYLIRYDCFRGRCDVITINALKLIQHKNSVPSPQELHSASVIKNFLNVFQGSKSCLFWSSYETCKQAYNLRIKYRTFKMWNRRYI
jgi:hypothetical protein